MACHARERGVHVLIKKMDDDKNAPGRAAARPYDNVNARLPYFCIHHSDF